MTLRNVQMEQLVPSLNLEEGLSQTEVNRIRGGLEAFLNCIRIDTNDKGFDVAFAQAFAAACLAAHNARIKNLIAADELVRVELPE